VVFLEVLSVRSAGKKICKNLKVLFSFLFEGYVPTINLDVQIVYHFVDENIFMTHTVECSKNDGICCGVLTFGK